MFSKINWRRLCVFACLVCHDRFVSGLEVTPLSTSSSKYTRSIRSLSSRASLEPDRKCPVDGQISCGIGVPDDFCCASDRDCWILAAGTTALCCPKGESCNAITTITCNVALQNVTERPDSIIHTTKLDEALPKCGDQCCPFGYKCRDDNACVLDEDQPRSSSASVSVGTPSAAATKTKTPTQATTNAAATTGTERPPASSTPSASSAQEASLPAATAPSQPPETTAAAATSSGRSTSGGVIAGTTIAAVASVAGLTLLIWLKRRAISEKVGSATFPRPWQLLRQHRSDEDVPLPRYSRPPPAYNNDVVEAKGGPPTREYTFKHYSPESIGNSGPVELPATPVSFSVWNARRNEQRPRSHFEPYRRPE